MNDIKISKKLKKNCPDIRLGVIQSDIEYQKENSLLWQETEKVSYQIRDSLSQKQIANLPVIRHTRQAYLSMGKEPARYRCSAEALLRRVVKGKDLYRINNVVDMINFISLSSCFSIGCYDFDQLIVPIIFDIGKMGETYHAIGRGKMNIESLPVFRDKIGPFGSPTSDSERSMITEKTRNIIIVIIDFNGKDPLKKALDSTLIYLEQYAGARQVNYAIY
jgi:DNA/RNA-binding domain of Phe-tRNA-synthetase-like protein